MKRLMLIAAAMTLGGAAVAQNTTTTTRTTTDTAPTTADPAAPADAGTMQSMQNDPAMSQPTQTDSSQSMQQQQPTSNSGNMSAQGMSMQSEMAPGNYPRCSRTVTDRCIQAAGGTSRARARRRR